MNISEQIINKLHDRQEVVLAGLGRLVLQKKPATISEETQKLLPPKYGIAFEVDRSVKADNEFSSFAHQLLKKLLSTGESDVEGIGKWALKAGKITFLPEDKGVEYNFFGFEEISLPEPSRKWQRSAHSPAETDNFRRWILWFFLIIVPALMLVGLFLWKGKQIFNSQLLNDLSITTHTHRITTSTEK